MERPLRGRSEQEKLDPLEGNGLKKAVLDVGHRIADDTPLFNAFINNIDVLPSEIWRTPRNLAEINTFYNAASAALQYAHVKSKRSLIPLEELATPDDCWGKIQQMLADPIMRESFYNGLWRLPISFAPERKLAPSYILRHHFPGKRVTGIEIGAGPGILLPLLNSSMFMETEVPEKEKLLSLLGPEDMTVDFGLQVDINDHEENLLWAACNPSSWLRRPGVLENVLEEIKPKKDAFPYLTQDITDELAVTRIKQTLQEHNRTPQVNFVLSSFVRYQLPQDEGTQRSFVDTVTELLQEGGIWIDIGDELRMSSGHKFDKYATWVYTKRQGGMTEPKVAFNIQDGGTIVETKLDYFRS